MCHITMAEVAVFKSMHSVGQLLSAERIHRRREGSVPNGLFWVCAEDAQNCHPTSDGVLTGGILMFLCPVSL